MNKSASSLPDENPAIVWANLLVQELVRCGLTDVCISPGSRSTPLTLAFHAHAAIQVHLHLDERSAAFFALGMALGQDRPVAVLCTSGTAGANYYPAVIEAHMSEVPLLILTADRPPELRHSGANQTIDQTRLFGEHALWSVDVALPEQDAPELALRNLRTLAARAYARANGLRKGPVHLNFPFRKPLEPTGAASIRPEADNKVGRPFTTFLQGQLNAKPEQQEQIAQMIAAHEQGLIVCGPRCPGGEFAAAVSELALRSAYPILADPLSGVRFGPHTSRAPVCGAYETFLSIPDSLPEPTLVIHFGAGPTSKRLDDFLAKNDSAAFIHVRESGTWSDANHRTNYLVQANPAALCRSLITGLPERGQTAWLELWMAREQRTWSALVAALETNDFDGAAVFALVNSLPDDSVLFAGNSLPIRHVDQFARPSVHRIQVYANRGASGIDGNLSTGLGLARASGKPTTILVGDTTFYHDSNGLFGLRHVAADKVTIVLLNNDGGGIFQRLPIAQFDPPFTSLYRASHGLDLSGFAAVYGLTYFGVPQAAHFHSYFRRDDAGERAALLEYRSDPVRDNDLRSHVEAMVQAEFAQS